MEENCKIALPLNFSEEEYNKIMDLAACNFTPERIAVQLGIDKKSFLKLFFDKSSDVRQAYDAGKDKATFNVINAQRDLAEKGNITAAQIFLKESKELEVANIRNQCLFGDDD